MNPNFLILRRSAAESEVFGGDVYIDIDGKNVGILSSEDFPRELSPGKHVLKMYKSHTMSSFIGVAEKEFEVADGGVLFARYSPPMMASQAGTIILANYESQRQLDELSERIASQLRSDFAKEEQIKTTREEESKKNGAALFAWIFVVPLILGLVYWLVTMNQINSVMRSLP